VFIFHIHIHKLSQHRPYTQMSSQTLYADTSQTLYADTLYTLYADTLHSVSAPSKESSSHIPAIKALESKLIMHYAEKSPVFTQKSLVFTQKRALWTYLGHRGKEGVGAAHEHVHVARTLGSWCYNLQSHVTHMNEQNEGLHFCT